MNSRIQSFLTKLLKIIQFRIDTTNYFFDSPKSEYQPNPWAGIPNCSIRGEPTIERWATVAKCISKNEKSLKDIGCCTGFFCISASETFHLRCIGVDANESYIRIANYSVPSELSKFCHFLTLQVDQESVAILPTTDLTICFSIWHHWVFHFGLDAATSILKTIWEKTNKQLFFESGEEEIQEEFNLPYPKGVLAKDWLLTYLGNNLPGSNVEELGMFSAGQYSHYLSQGKKRTLFRVIKGN